jgi:hypothetical protein
MLPRRGDVGPMMWILIGLIVLVAVIGVIFVLKGKSLDAINIFKGLLG